jgi:hypothetical protein
MNDVQAATWLLLITNLPGRNPTLRMRLWRALKATGAGPLRDGVYVLPISEVSRRAFEEQATEIKGAGGTAHIVSFEADSPRQQAAFMALFDRTAEYQEASRNLETLKRSFPKLKESEARQRLAALRRDIGAIVARDFFPAATREQIESALADAETAFNARFSPDEPRSVITHQIQRCDRKEYRARTWATREHLWIDRVASAWLIRRFIDPKARFLWLERVKDCPKRAIGFDFDGAKFTHVGTKVTFEVLVASFGLDHDEGLMRLGALVHHLDVGGIPTAEGPGFAAVMAGARALQPDDDALLEAMTSVLDSLYETYSSAPDNQCSTLSTN